MMPLLKTLVLAYTAAGVNAFATFPSQEGGAALPERMTYSGGTCPSGMTQFSGGCIDVTEQEPSECSPNGKDIFGPSKKACEERGLALCSMQEYLDAYMDGAATRGSRTYGISSTTCLRAHDGTSPGHYLIKYQGKRADVWGCHGNANCWSNRYYRCCSGGAARSTGSYPMVGQNAEAPVGYVAKASSGPCMCRRSGWGLDSCGKLCCARSPYTATDPSNKYFFGKHPNPTARTDANLCWEALPSPPCGLNEYRTETGGDCKAVKVTCGDGAEVVDGECVAKVACGAGTKNENGKCVPEVTCGGGTKVENGKCIPEVTCGDGAEVVNGECVAKVECGAGTKNENGECVPEVTCGGGAKVVDGKCVPEVTCGDGTVTNGDNTGCVLKSGYGLIEACRPTPTSFVLPALPSSLTARHPLRRPSGEQQ